MARPGRPRLPAHERRSKTYPVRFTPPEWSTLASRAESAGVSMSELIRAAALDRRLRPRPRVPAVNRAAWAEASRLSGSLARVLNAHRHGELLELREGLLEELRQALLAVRAELLGRGGKAVAE